MKTTEQRCRDAGVNNFISWWAAYPREHKHKGGGISYCKPHPNHWNKGDGDHHFRVEMMEVAYNAACEQFLPIIKQKDAEIADLYSGKRGACATCEPVGELNQKLIAEIADLKNETAKMRTMFDLDYGESYKAYLAEYKASELTPKEAFIFQMLNHLTVQLNARIKELENEKMNKHTGSALDKFLDECGIEPFKINDCCHKVVEVYESRIALLMEGKDAEIKWFNQILSGDSKKLAARLTKAMGLLDELEEFVDECGCRYGRQELLKKIEDFKKEGGE